MRIKFAWYDMWVGAFWDRKRRILYICPLPMLLIEIPFNTNAPVVSLQNDVSDPDRADQKP